MAIDIVLQGLKISKNGLSDYFDRGNKGLPGIITLSWFHCRPDLPHNVLTWSFKVNEIKRDIAISLNDYKWYETLAFRQTACGQSILKIEVTTIQDQDFMAKIMGGVLGLGIKTVGGLIVNPIASSVYETLTSSLELDKATIHNVGTATYTISPGSNMKYGNLTLGLNVDKKKIILPPRGQSYPSDRREGYYIEGANGEITLNISEFNSNASQLNMARLESVPISS